MPLNSSRIIKRRSLNSILPLPASSPSLPSLEYPYSKAIHYPNAPSSHYPNAAPQILQNPRQLIQLLFATPFLLTIFGLLAFSQRLDSFSPSIIDSFNTSNMEILYLLHQLHNLAHIGSLLCFNPLK